MNYQRESGSESVHQGILHDTTYSPNRSLLSSTQCLAASAVFPLSTLTYMFLHWERGGLEETALSDTDEEEEGEEDGDDEADIGYITHKEYEVYVL